MQAVLLGIAQDAGVPQAGCWCNHCQQARHNATHRQFAVCLGLVDHHTRQSWLIDATPDFKEQLHLLHNFAPDCSLSGIILTHAHIGHYTGLIHLGPEVMNTRRMPVYASEQMTRFLTTNAPWSQLAAREHIVLHRLTANVEIDLSVDLSLLPVPVPHRDEFSDTLAFVVRGPARRLFYCPDIDRWDAWAHNLREFVAQMDVALLDATFFSPSELPGRDLSKIPHPLATDTVVRLADAPCDVRLIHLNHSNPLLSSGPEQEWLAAHGFTIGHTGDWWMLA